MKILYLTIGGALGTCLRYFVSSIIYRILGVGFPWGTLVVNLIGCFAIGFLWEQSERAMMWAHFRTLVFIGILGAFTTFSTYGLETFNLFRDGEFGIALTDVAMSNLLGLGFVFAGFALSKLALG